MAPRRGFGQITSLPSGRFRARYTGPDGARHPAPYTFETRMDAEAWLAAERRIVTSEEPWVPPKLRRPTPTHVTFGSWAESWLANRKVKGQPLADRTRAHYRVLLDRHIYPTFEDLPLKAITPDLVDHWYITVGTGAPTIQAHAYSLLRTILGTAVDRNLIAGANPARVRGGGSTKPVRRVRPATLDELAALTNAMPPRFRLMILLASFCALRFGELVELRRRDLDTERGVVLVRRGVVRAEGKVIIKTPKSDAGIRDVAVPPHLRPVIADHLARYAEPGADGLLFPATRGGNLTPQSLYKVYYPARDSIGRPDLRFHDLRHTGAVLAAQTGATLAELMGRLGHATPAAALRYQHVALERDQQIAAALSEMVSRNATADLAQDDAADLTPNLRM